MAPFLIPSWVPSVICSTVRRSPSRYFSINASSCSAAASSRLSWAWLNWSLISSGTSSAAVVRRLTTFENSACLPTGNSNGMQFLPNAARIWSTHLKKSLFSLSSLLTKISRGVSSSSSSFQARRVPTSTPLTPSTTTTAASAAWIAATASPTKSATPGVSSR